ncbi:LETM1-like protein-domain-containing protein [Limtongia smithiae]|uniref:LETM1-like protein-domain-containing protein n=1 Tax=Limtongia smithiae TaxID=1125753 RepID=UPI0034CE063A
MLRCDPAATALLRRAAVLRTSSATVASASAAAGTAPRSVLRTLYAAHYYSTETAPASAASRIPPSPQVLSGAKKIAASSGNFAAPPPPPLPTKAEAVSEKSQDVKELNEAKKTAEASADKAAETILGKEEATTATATTVAATTITAAATPATTPAVPATNSEKIKSLMSKIKAGLMHVWDGTRLLGVEIKISSKLAYKMAAGYELTRRESRQLKRTTEDLVRLVPFSVFVIVPFAELLLPVALKLFPNMLPSTFEGASAKEDRIKTLRKTRKEMSDFIRNTVTESGLQLPQTSNPVQRELFAEFFRKVRTSGESPSREELLSVCRLFKDDIVLDNLSRPQLVAMAKYMNLPTFGSDMVLRYHIRHRMRQTKKDDRAIDWEGVTSLSVPELQSACQSRGIKSFGVSPARLRDDLQNWLDLRLRQNVPSTLLVLSAAYTYGAAASPSHYDALLSVLSSIPDELYHEAELQVNHAEGTATNKQRLEVVKEQEELIKDENEQVVKSGKVVKDTESIDEPNKVADKVAVIAAADADAAAQATEVPPAVAAPAAPPISKETVAPVATPSEKLKK